uniref:Uncharacterized protein n=1 Tax=Knipowitschia caucasica TaxID=637954 RepID=A0AAV2LIC6_KNICA
MHSPETPREFTSFPRLTSGCEMSPLLFPQPRKPHQGVTDPHIASIKAARYQLWCAEKDLSRHETYVCRGSAEFSGSVYECTSCLCVLQ